MPKIPTRFQGNPSKIFFYIIHLRNKEINQQADTDENATSLAKALNQSRWKHNFVHRSTDTKRRKGSMSEMDELKKMSGEVKAGDKVTIGWNWRLTFWSKEKLWIRGEDDLSMAINGAQHWCHWAKEVVMVARRAWDDSEEGWLEGI